MKRKNKNKKKNWTDIILILSGFVMALTALAALVFGIVMIIQYGVN